MVMVTFSFLVHMFVTENIYIYIYIIYITYVYILIKQLLHFVRSYDDCVYIRRTYQSKVKKFKVPHQTVANKLSVEWLPGEFRNFRQLETVLIERRILFKNVTVIPKG